MTLSPLLVNALNWIVDSFTDEQLVIMASQKSFPGQKGLQSNLSTMANLGRDESGCFREVAIMRR